MTRRTWLSLAAPLVAVLLLCAVPAAARTLTFERWSDQIQVRPDGSVLVTETLTVRFTGAWNGIYRTIPLEYHTNQGFGYHLNVSVDSVIGRDFETLRYEQSHSKGNLKLKIYVPGATNATRTVVIRYVVENGLRFFDDHDELYWNVTGNDHTDLIEQADATVTLPGGATGVHAAVYTGIGGSKQSEATIEQRPNEVQVTATRPLGSHEGLTAVVGWDKGFITPPGPLRLAWDFLLANWPLGIPIVALLFAVWFYFAHGRDPELRPISVQYEPPQSLSPAGSGALIDDSADMCDITATIVDLAVHGYLTIEERESGGILHLGSSKDFIFHLKKSVEQWNSLRPHEAALMSALFDSGATESVKLSDLRNRFYTNLPQLRESIFGELLGRHYYRTRPDTMHQRYIAGAMGAGIGIFWVGAALSKHTGMAIPPFAVAAVLTAIIIFVYGRAVHARTMEGTRALEGVLGFKEFLGRVEGNRYNLIKLTPDMFEKFLPFAMAFGVESHWAKAFDGIFHEPPSWYVGGVYGPQFYPSSFTSSLSGMASHAGSVMSSAPASSGSSGFSGGGGSSGGGFGGGGAGGF